MNFKHRRCVVRLAIQSDVEDERKNAKTNQNQTHTHTNKDKETLLQLR